MFLKAVQDVSLAHFKQLASMEAMGHFIDAEVGETLFNKFRNYWKTVD